MHLKLYYTDLTLIIIRYNIIILVSLITNYLFNKLDQSLNKQR